MPNKYLLNLRVTFSGRLLYRMLPIRKQIVLDNIDRVFKEGATPKKKYAWLNPFILI